MFLSKGFTVQAFLTKYSLPLHLAVMASSVLASLCVPLRYGGVTVLVLAVSAAEFVFLLPSVHTGETFADARDRVCGLLVRDAFFYIGLLGLLMALSQWLNSGCSLVYQPGADVWQISLPPVRGLPFSVKPSASGPVLVRAAAAFVGVCALRCAVGKRGKKKLFALLGCVSGVIAVTMMARTAAHPEAVSPQPAGFLFGFWAIAGLGSYLAACQSPEDKKIHVALVCLGIGANTVGALYFASAFWSATFLLLMSILVLYGFFFLARRAAPRQLMSYAGFFFLLSGGAILILGYLLPGNPIQRHFHFLMDADFKEVWDAWFSVWRTRMDAALDVWRGHPGWGVGADGFRKFAGFSLTGKAWAAFKKDPGLVYNDFLQFLCEYGLVGFVLFFAAFLSLSIPVVFRCRSCLSRQDAAKDGLDKRDFFRLDPFFFTGALAVVFGAVQAWFASPFHAPGYCFSWMMVLASLPVFLPEAGD